MILKVLVACEYSGVVRRAFRKLGHDAWSCDVLPSLDNSEFHIQGDCLKVLDKGWDLLIAHPPCTHLSVSGARSFYYKKGLQNLALSFVQRLMSCSIKHKCIENPVSIISSRIRKPTQIIQPYQFGHWVSKKTCLWLTRLPLLQSTQIVSLDTYEQSEFHSRTPKAERSITFTGVADAMADQWSRHICRSANNLERLRQRKLYFASGVGELGQSVAGVAGGKPGRPSSHPSNDRDARVRGSILRTTQATLLIS